MVQYRDPVAQAYAKLCESASIEEAIDNGPNGRVKTDNINYGQTRNLTGYTYSKPELDSINAKKVEDRKARQAKEKWYQDYAEKKEAARLAKNDHTKVTWSDYQKAFDSIPDIDPSDEVHKLTMKHGITHEAASRGLDVHAQADGYKDFWDAHSDQMHNYHELMSEINH